MRSVLSLMYQWLGLNRSRSPSFRRRCVTANRLLSPSKANTKLFGFLRRHYRLCLAKHLVFLGSHMCLDELLQFLELRYPLMVVSRTDFELIQKRFNLAVRFEGFMCSVTCGLGLLKDSIDLQIFYCG